MVGLLLFSSDSLFIKFGGEALSNMTEDELQYSDEYAEYILKHNNGQRIICNGDTLICAMEDGFLFDEYLEFIGWKSEEIS